jgi:hypothetical protein
MESTILILHTNGDRSYIDVLPSQNLSDARAIILNEFDADQLPSHSFQFKVNGLRVSRAQEKSHVVADIHRLEKKVEIVARLAPLPVNHNVVTPPADNVSFANTGLTVNRHTSKRPAVACMDTSKSTVSGGALAKSLDDGARIFGAKQEGQVNCTAFETPIPKKPPQIQQHDGCKPSAPRAGILPQKRSASENTLLNPNTGKERILGENAKRDGKLRQECNAPLERCTAKPSASQNSSSSSDGSKIKISTATPSIVKKIEVKRTVEILDLCDTDEEDSKPASFDSKPLSTTAPISKDFILMNGSQRKVYWSDKKNLSDFFEKTMSNPTGAECEVCAEARVDKRCNSCGKFYHGVCVDESCHEVCLACQMNDNLQCHLCNQEGGIVVKSIAKPGSMKKWKGKMTEYEKSLFGSNKFCHAICGL